MEDLIQILVNRNGWEYNIRKSVEKLNELATVLMQKHNKKGGVKEPNDQEIIDEIGDVIIRMAILSRIFGDDKIGERVELKMNRFLDYIEQNKYKHI